MNNNYDAIDKDGNNIQLNLSELKNKNIVLYFYPKDNTPGCTQEACDFRDNLNRLSNEVILLAVSINDIKSHIKFREKNNLNFTLISDPEHKLCDYFGVWKEKTMCGRKYMGIERSTFILNSDKNIVKEWRNVKVKGHVDEVLNFLKTI